MSTQIFRLINEAEAQLCRGVRASYWQPVIDAARAENQRNEAAFDDQTRELEIALEVMTPEQRTEYRHRTYPTLHPREPEDTEFGTNGITAMGKRVEELEKENDELGTLANRYHL